MTRFKVNLKGEFAMVSFFSLGQATMMPNHTALITVHYITEFPKRNYSIFKKKVKKNTHN